MDMRDGMLGVVIIAIALAVALFGSYLAGVTPQEESVIKYNYLADVSGEFKYDQSPQYIDFDPSTNYTGYYSNESYSELDKKYYFAEDEVGFSLSQTEDGKKIVNNYRVDLKPTPGTESYVDLLNAGFTREDKRSFLLHYVYNIEGDNVMWISASSDTIGGVVSIKTFIQKMEIPEEYTNVKIALDPDANWDGTPTHHPFSHDELVIDSPLIFPYSGGEVYITSPNRDPSTYSNLNFNITKPIMSLDVDLSTWNVNAYISSDYSGTPTTYSADNLLLCYGQRTAGESQNYDYLTLGTDITYLPVIYRDSIYLDPKYGVHLEEEAS